MSLVHIIGAGVTGLSAATKLAAAHVPVRLYEATAHAGGRARSSNHSALGSIDHGLHLIQGDSPELFAYLTRIGARDALARVNHPLAFSAAPMVDYAELLSALTTRDGHAQEIFSPDNILRHGWASRAARLLFHTPLEHLSARATQRFARRFLRHARRATAHMAAHSNNESFIAPALAQLEYMGGSVYFNHALRALERKDGRVTALAFARQKIALGQEDVVILTTPAHQAAQLIPSLRAGGESTPAITVHYAVAHREPDGVCAPEHAPVDMVRYSQGRISVMIRVATAVWHSDPDFLAARLWKWLTTQHPYLDAAMPEHAVWREKNASHALTPDHAPYIPPLPERLLVAGDWCEAHVPASLEHAAASGHRAADAALALLGNRPLRHQ